MFSLVQRPEDLFISTYKMLFFKKNDYFSVILSPVNQAPRGANPEQIAREILT